MHDLTLREEMERLERTMQRVFARVSFLEARVNELERELVLVGPAVREGERPQLVEALGRTA
jgi:hypothetical protein